MKYLTTSELSKQWGISTRRIGTLCKEGRIEGAILKGKTWIIPDDIAKPLDMRCMKIINRKDIDMGKIKEGYLYDPVAKKQRNHFYTYIFKNSFPAFLSSHQYVPG